MTSKLPAPFNTWPRADFQSAEYGRAWYCENGIIVSWAENAWGTESGVGHYLDWESDLIDRKARALDEAGGLYVIHDWRIVTGYESGARTRWQHQMKQRPKGYLRGSTVVVARKAPLLRMAVQAANLVASITQLGKVELDTDLTGVLRSLRVTPVGRRNARGPSLDIG